MGLVGPVDFLSSYKIRLTVWLELRALITGLSPAGRRGEAGRVGYVLDCGLRPGFVVNPGVGKQPCFLCGNGRNPDLCIFD